MHTFLFGTFFFLFFPSNYDQPIWEGFSHYGQLEKHNIFMRFSCKHSLKADCVKILTLQKAILFTL